VSIIRPAARRYAQAIFALAREDNSYDRWCSELEQIAALFAIPLAAKALTSPVLSAERKVAVIETEVPDLQPRTRNLLRLLAHHNRLRLLPEIASALRELVNRARGIATARVTTAVPLDAAAQELLAERLGRYLGQQVELETTVDPSIIGGVIARVGDLLLDGSVRGRLEALRRRLLVASGASRHPSAATIPLEGS